MGCLQVHTKIVRPLSLQRRSIHWQTSKPTPAPPLMAPASRMVASLLTFCDSSHLEIVGPRIVTWFESKKQTLHEGTPTTARARPGQRPAKPGKAVRSSKNSLIVIRNHGFGSSAQAEIFGVSRAIARARKPLTDKTKDSPRQKGSARQNACGDKSPPG